MISDLILDGVTGEYGDYVVTVTVNDDIALTLDADSAARYCAVVFRAGIIAQHDAAIIRQLARGATVTTVMAAETVAEMRVDRPQLDDASTAPLRFEPIVSATDFRPYVHIWANGERVSQWTPTVCFQHASYVMQTLAGVDLDTAYFRYLVDTIELPADSARGAVMALGDHDTGLRKKKRAGGAG